MTTTIKSNSDGSSAIQTNGVDRIQIDTSGNTLLVNTPATGDKTKKIANTEFIANNCLGISQTWQNVASTRVIGTSYTNLTGKPIQVNIATTSNSVTNTATLTIDGIVVATNGLTNGATATLSAIVPPASVYTLTATNSTVSYWAELR